MNGNSATKDVHPDPTGEPIAALLEPAAEGQTPNAPPADLAARNDLGFLYLGVATAATGAGIALGRWDLGPGWALGQLLVAAAFLQWFSLLHEAGHGTLFRTRWLNRAVGPLAAVGAGIPWASWQRVHHRHHVWTGWQDRDATTANLVRGPLGPIERALVNGAWKARIPLFSALYRWSNYWNLVRLRRWFHGRDMRHMVRGVVLLAGVYAVAGAVCGDLLLRNVWPGLLVGAALQDALLLSQHTHLPMPRAGERPVRPLPPRGQLPYTRSLRFAPWFSRVVLVGMGHHELHHLFPRIPGYHLHRVAWRPPGMAPGWAWIRRARRVPGEVFLFQNRAQSGLDL